MAAASDSSGLRPPAPAPDIVTASRRHLADKYARGVDQLFWELEKRPMQDADAVKAVLGGAAAEVPAEALDVAAALVLVQAMRLDLDLLEADILDLAQASGVPAESVAAVLELPGAATAERRHQMLRARRELPRAEVPPHRFLASQEKSSDAAARAGRRASQAAGRAAEAQRRRDQLEGGVSGITREDTEEATARAGEARVNAREAAERVALGLLRAADALERCAERCADWRRKTAPAEQHEQLRRREEEYAKAAVNYREMAAKYRDIGASGHRGIGKRMP